MSNDRYSFQHTDGTGRSLRLLNVASAKYNGDWHSVLHTHSYAELFYVIGGTGHIQIDQELYPLSPKQLVIINPNVLHTERSVNASPLEYVVLGIDGLELPLRSNQESRFWVLENHDADNIYACIRSILEETHSGLTGSEIICQAYMEILVTRLMRSADFVLNQNPIPSSNNQCAIVRRYIDAHFKEQLTLERLAEIARVNKFYLVHAFKREYGISPISYLIQRRLEESRYLLRQTDITLSQIAQILGFSSASYFSQSFRRAEGMTPMEYRKSAKGPDTKTTG